MFGSLGIFQAMIQALKSVVEGLIGTTSDTYADGTVLGYSKTGIKSIQRGTTTIDASVSSATATISSVTTTKAEVHLLGTEWSAGQNSGYPGLARIALANATTVTATRGGTDGTLVVSFEVIEYL